MYYVTQEVRPNVYSTYPIPKLPIFDKKTRWRPPTMCVCACARHRGRISEPIFTTFFVRVGSKNCGYPIVFGDICNSTPIFCACAVIIYIETASKHVKSATNRHMSVTNHKTDVQCDALSASKCVLHMPNPFWTKKQDGGHQLN